MSTRALAWLAWSAWALCVTLAALAVVLGVYTMSVGHHSRLVVLAGIPLLIYPTAGALVASRHPKNAVGWVLCGMGLIFEVLAFAGAYAEYTLFAQPSSPIGKMVDEIASPFAVTPIVVLGVVVLIVLFPDGRLPARYFRGVLWMAVGGTALVTTLMLVPWPEGGFGRLFEDVAVFGYLVIFLACIASGFAVLERLQSAGVRERQQQKWFAYGTAIFLGAFFFVQFAEEQTSRWLVFAVIVIGLLAIPVTVGIAILKHHLYDIDVVINRTLVYALLTAVLVAVYLGGVTLLQGVLRGLTGQNSTLAVVGSTLVIAALFTPLRRRIQSFIDRRFYRSKYDATKTLEVFSAKLRDETDLDALSDDLIGVVRETMQPAHVSLWLRPDTASQREQTDQ
jgi:hypothetical protein